MNSFEYNQGYSDGYDGLFGHRLSDTDNPFLLSSATAGNEYAAGYCAGQNEREHDDQRISQDS